MCLNMTEERQYKVILIGESFVGKTSILQRIMNQGYFTQSSTIQAAFVKTSRTISVEEGQYSVNVNLWDIPGNDRFGGPGPIFYRSSACIIIVYDVTDRESFNRVNHWFDESRKIAFVGDETISFAIVGNKKDLKHMRQVTYQEGVELCKSLRQKMPYLKFDNNDEIGPVKYREKCQLLSDGYLRKCEHEHREFISFIPMIFINYVLCFISHHRNQA